MLTPKDLYLLASKEISPAQVEKQISFFKAGMKPVRLVRPAVKNDGIEVFDDGGVLMYAGLFDKYHAPYSKIKFVPASGAASRMFKDLFSALDQLITDPYMEKEMMEQDKNLKHFFSEIENFAFFDDLNEAALKAGENIEKLTEEKKFSEVLNLLLNKQGLNYGSKPKGVLKFHKYPASVLSPVEEHLHEAAQYLVNRDKTLKLHFTVSPEHLSLFKDITDNLSGYFQKRDIQPEISYSVQEPSTDTLAVNLSNEPFREDDGSLHFRPGGHGALLLNLGKLDEEIIFIGNIDNVSTDKDKPRRALYKKFLGGYLLEKLKIIRQLLQNLETGINFSVRNDIIHFIKNYISGEVAIAMAKLNDPDFTDKAFSILNRPVRVCGMVRNTGEPGGGPFWVESGDGNISKQIIESSQIDTGNSAQKEIFNSSTHFNPVDIVCCIRDFKGNKFDLSKYRDDDMAFIAKKSSGGRELKALELPGLWNGSMAGWITFFNEVPVETFSPVKTVFDLLRPEHQA